MTTSLKDLLQLIEDRQTEIQTTSVLNNRPNLHAVFADAISQTMEEIKKGADSDSFTDLVVLNFITKAAQKNYTSDEIKLFIDNELLQ